MDAYFCHRETLILTLQTCLIYFTFSFTFISRNCKKSQEKNPELQEQKSEFELNSKKKVPIGKLKNSEGEKKSEMRNVNWYKMNSEKSQTFKK